MKYLFLLCIFCLSIESQSKILLISDIDDTLKISFVRNTTEMIFNYKTTAQYTGMSDLYKTLRKQYKDELIINYVTGAPSNILGSDTVKNSHLNFLKVNSFPAGTVYFNPNFLEKNYKFNTIQKIVTTLKPTQVILLGDNGNKDEPIYYNLQKEFKNKGIPTIIFMHRIFENLNDQNQSVYQKSNYSYITSVEVAAYLRNLKILSDPEYNSFLNRKLLQVIKEKSNNVHLDQEIAFPEYLNCVDYRWGLDSNVELNGLKKEIEKRCLK